MKVPDSLQKLGINVFKNCSELVPSDINESDNDAVVAHLRSLREMKVPDSLQTFGSGVFLNCSKLVSSEIDDLDNEAVVAYLRSIQ